MNEEIHDRFYDDIDGEKHFNSTQLVERYHCEGNGALCDMDCENCELYKKYHTKEPWHYEINGFSRAILLGDKLTSIGYISDIVNTERIVACVNACADVADEKLKMGYVKELEAKKVRLETILEAFIYDMQENVSRIKDCKYEPDKILIFCEGLEKALKYVKYVEGLFKEDV